MANAQAPLPAHPTPISTPLPYQREAQATGPLTGPPSSEPPLSTNQPTDSLRETSAPALPSPTPTLSPTPLSSRTPIALPTSTRFPSDEPSSIPSDAPSDTPSLSPTEAPSTASAKFRQKFTIGNGRVFLPEEIILFQGLYRSYTINFAPRTEVVEGRIETICDFISQVGLEGRRLLRKKRYNVRSLQTSFQFVEVDFTMSYKSVETNVSSYPVSFQSYVNENLEKVAEQLVLLSLNVTEVSIASRIIVRPEPTPAPSSSRSPSIGPTMEPSFSKSPSLIPSDMPSLTPSSMTIEPSDHPNLKVTQAPYQVPSSKPTSPPDGERDGLASNTVIVVSFVVAGSIVLIGLLVYYRKRKLLRELEFQSNAAGGKMKSGRGPSLDEGSWNAVVQKPTSNDNVKTTDTPNHASAFKKVNYQGSAPPVLSADGMVSPSESLVSNQSLLSAGNSMAGDSGDEADATHNLADEFDQYKDQNLEKMRADVEGNLTGFDGMMSQALTRALIDDDDAIVDPVELLWGGSGSLTGAEIEASALGEVTDWLKRKDSASVEEK
jgi:hypothetical protein